MTTKLNVMVGLALALSVSAACGSKKPKAKTAPTAPDSPAASKKIDEKPIEAVKDDQQVSPGLAVSGDIASACGLKVATPAGANPKFDYDKDELTAEDRQVLDQIAVCLTTGALKGKAVSLIGRADPRGTEEYNLGLGSRRSHTVSQYLGRLGVGEPQMAVTTRGALDAAGTDESGWKTDRRVDIQLQ
jgi:outer membrane protein OmpA-like peptidoglycan-associated protein